MLHKFGGQLVFAKHTGSDRCCDRRLEVCRRISFPYFPRSVLMESMHELVELERIDSPRSQRSNCARSAQKAVRKSRSWAIPAHSRTRRLIRFGTSCIGLVWLTLRLTRDG
jgi:hypothetical protein